MPKKVVGNLFLSRMADGADMLPLYPGVRHAVAEDRQEPQLFYERPAGKLFLGDCLQWLRTMPDESADLVFADPPYNIGKADWDVFESHDAYVSWSVDWIAEASRVLKATGSLYVCGFSEILADVRRPAAAYFNGCRWLVWHYRNKANLRNDWGRSHESILHFRKSKRTTFNVDDVRVPYGAHTLKYPQHPQATSSQYGKGQERKETWTPHPDGAKPRDVFEIPVTANGMPEKTPHPTQKPEELLRKLVLGSSNKDDLVLDPFAGSGTTLVAAEQLKRRWLGCELSAEYCEWAVHRLEDVPDLPVQEWIDRDRLTAQRRESIR